MLLILFVCIFDKTVHTIIFLHGFFASYTKEEDVHIVDNFLVTSSLSWKDHIAAYLPQSFQDPGIALVESRFNTNSSQLQQWLSFSREVQFFSPLEGHTAHVRIYKQIEANINKCKINHCWYLTCSLGSWSSRRWRCKDYLVNDLLAQILTSRKLRRPSILVMSSSLCY
jgi:hypothetical protein